MYRSHRFTTALVLALMFLALPAAADDEGWQLRFGGVWVDPDLSVDEVQNDGSRVRAEADSQLGLRLALEYRFSPRLGVEFGALWAEPDVEVTIDGVVFCLCRLEASDSLRFTSLTAGLNVHLTPEGPVDFYVGPLIAWVLYGDLGFRFSVGGLTDTVAFSSSDELAWGVQAGVDVPFGDGPWALNLAAQYLDTTLGVRAEDDGARSEIGFDPLVFSLGFSYRI